MLRCCLALLLLAALPTAAAAQPDPRSDEEPAPQRERAELRPTAPEDRPVFYVVDERPVLRAGPGVGRTLGRLDFRTGVRVRRADGDWRLVEGLEDGQPLGWVRAAVLSDVWMLVDKETRTLYVYRGAELVRELAADVSQNPDDDKVRRAALGEQDHYRIPEGTYHVVRKNLASQYYRSFVLSYPNAADAAAGLEAGLISEGEHAAIARAAERFQEPPMGTRLGGGIAIHGQGSGRRRAWTRGCVALRDVHLDAIWDLVHVGTPVFIR